MPRSLPTSPARWAGLLPCPNFFQVSSLTFSVTPTCKVLSSGTLPVTGALSTLSGIPRSRVVNFHDAAAVGDADGLLECPELPQPLSTVSASSPLRHAVRRLR